MRRFRPKKTIAPRYDDNHIAGLPDGAMVLSNSERREAWCSRRWMFSYGRSLATPPSIAMRWGSFYHAILEDIYTHWAITRSVDGESCAYKPEYMLICSGVEHGRNHNADCEMCHGTSLGPLARIREEVDSNRDYWDSFAEKYGGADGIIQSLYDAASGYLKRYGDKGPENYDIVGVEVPVCLPVRHPDTGKIYSSQVPVVETAAGWRVASFREKQPWKMVRLPWYQVGRLDAILRHKKTNDVYVLEFKTSANPLSYGKDLHLDNQVPGYVLALSENKTFPGTVKGYVWDVSSSRKHATPRVLKNGRLSLATSQTCPSWKFEESMRALMESSVSLDVEYVQSAKQLVHDLKEKVDPKLYHREWGHPSAEVLDRYRRELFVDVQRFAKMYRSLVTAETEQDVLSGFPRVPFCRGPGSSCSFAGICMEGGHSLDQMIEGYLGMPNTGFIQREKLQWLHRNAGLSSEENTQCPMF